VESASLMVSSTAIRPHSHHWYTAIRTIQQHHLPRFAARITRIQPIVVTLRKMQVNGTKRSFLQDLWEDLVLIGLAHLTTPLLLIHWRCAHSREVLVALFRKSISMILEMTEPSTFKICQKERHVFTILNLYVVDPDSQSQTHQTSLPTSWSGNKTESRKLFPWPGSSPTP